jgi:hypothetical protein
LSSAGAALTFRVAWGCQTPRRGPHQRRIGWQQEGAPGRGAFAPVAKGTLASGVRSIGCRVPTVGLSGAWQARKSVTFLGRDAQGLTSPAVTAARVMQPGVSTGGNQQWRMARRRRDGVRAAPSGSRSRSIAPPFVHRLSGPGRTLMESKTGVVPVPSLNLKIRLFERCGARGAFLFPYRQRTVVLTPCGWAGMAGPNGCAVAARSPAGPPGWVAVDCWWLRGLPWLPTRSGLIHPGDDRCRRSPGPMRGALWTGSP